MGKYDQGPKGPPKKRLTNYLQRLGLLQVISQPTHKEGRTLDHLYVPANLKDKVDVKVQFKYFSDHASLQIKLKKQRLRKMTWQKIGSHLAMTSKKQ